MAEKKKSNRDNEAKGNRETIKIFLLLGLCLCLFQFLPYMSGTDSLIIGPKSLYADNDKSDSNDDDHEDDDDDRGGDGDDDDRGGDDNDADDNDDDDHGGDVNDDDDDDHGSHGQGESRDDIDEGASPDDTNVRSNGLGNQDDRNGQEISLGGDLRDGRDPRGENEPGGGSGRVMRELSRLGFFDDLSPVSEEEESSLIGSCEK